MTKMTATRSRPKIVSDSRFRSRVRDILVVLPNRSPGLALKVTGDENVLMVFPRMGKPLASMRDLLSLDWYSVEVSEGKGDSDFERLEIEDVRTFLIGLDLAPA